MLHPSVPALPKLSEFKAMLCVPCPNALKGFQTVWLHAQDVRHPGSILGHSSMHPEHALWDEPKGAVLSGMPQASGDAHAHWVGCFHDIQPAPCASVVQEAHIWGWKPLPNAGMYGHLSGLDAVSAHGLPCLKMCGGEQSPHYCKVKNLLGCGKLNLSGSPVSFLMLGMCHTGYRLWQPYTPLAVPSYGYALHVPTCCWHAGLVSMHKTYVYILGRQINIVFIGVIAVIPAITPNTVIVESPINKDVPEHACCTGCMYIAYIESTAHLCSPNCSRL